jgi:hypothetical protein
MILFSITSFASMRESLLPEYKEPVSMLLVSYEKPSLMFPMLGYKPSLWITHKENGP